MRKRFAYIMACCLVFSQLPVRSFAATTNTGESIKQTTNAPSGDLEVTVNLDYPVYNLEEMGLKAVVLDQSGKEIDSVKLTSVTRTEGEACYAIFEDLPIGTYKVELRGKNYKTYLSNEIELVKNEKHLIINAGNDTFTIGDINADGKIDDIDLSLMEQALQQEDSTYDLNGDKLVDIEDLAQLFWSKTTNGSVEIVSGKRIITEDIVKTEEIKTELEALNNGEVEVKGEIANLLTGNGEEIVVFERTAPITEETPIKIPLVFAEKMPVSEISFEAPADCAPTAGYVVYIDENGQEQKVSFTTVETLEARAGRAATKVIKINLGKQVPLQKLTIEVTETSAQNGLLASISKIEFLEDVVDNSINQEQGIIKGFRGKALDGGATLSWNQTANITGYKVQYGTESGKYEDVVYVKTNSAIIEGLENETPYYFVVQAMNGDWLGPVSEEITVTPTPTQIPSAPTNVNVTSYDKALKLSYSTGEDSKYVNVYYKKSTDTTYTKISGINEDGSLNEAVRSNMIIKNLENDVEYMIYVTANNDAGESAPSSVVRVTPVKEEIVMPTLPTVGRISNDAIKSIALSAFHEGAFYPAGSTPECLIDGSYDTHWTATGNGWWKDKGVVVEFNEPHTMDYVAVVPRLDRDYDRHSGHYKYWQYALNYSVTVWETPDSEPKLIADNKPISKLGKDGLLILPFERTQVSKIEVRLYEWNGAGQMSISEVMFYDYQDMVERVNDIFENGTFTEVKKGVTVEQIDNLINEINSMEGAVFFVDRELLIRELESAKEILTNGEPSNLGEVVEVVQTRQRDTASKQNFAMNGLSNLQATGVMANTNDEIVVYVDAPEDGVLPKLVVSQYFGKADDGWAKEITLTKGRNVIQVPRVGNSQPAGGPLYVSYTGGEQETTTVRILDATKIPTVELTSLDNEEEVKATLKTYVTELASHVETLPTSNIEKNPKNATEIGTDKVLLSLPADVVYRSLSEGTNQDVDAQVERLYEGLLTWDLTMKLHYTVLGLTEDNIDPKHAYPKSRLNVRYMPMNNGVFMYAAGDHVGIQYNSGAGLVKGFRGSENGYFGWGINHEIGHVINDVKYVIPEVTNNIFALFAQEVGGGKTRFEMNDGYEKIYQKVVSKDSGLSSDGLVNLGMFWQLHLAYDEDCTLDLGDFYPRLHQISRESNFTDSPDNLNYFVRIASDAAQKDLTPFFERWGIKITNATREYIASKGYEKETAAIYYLTDEAVRYRMDGGKGMDEGVTASITASVGIGTEAEGGANDQVVTLNLSSTMEQDALLGYEIYRDGELIAFTAENTYQDDIVGNNVTHQYSVVAYDKLLNKTEVVKSDEVYIAAEGIIDRSLYTINRTTAGALQIAFDSTPEVVGVKFSNVTETPNITVEVSTDGENWAVAKQDTLKEGIMYFNKPGAEANDDRIWTYDATYIRITGQGIENFTDEQIDVITYPGDAVYFTDGTIGRLDSDYHFGGGVIEKGTLVVMGSYRGHPVYSKIVLSAEYVAEKDYDDSERPGYDASETVTAVEGDMYMFAELPEDEQVSKVGNGIWLFVPKEQSLPSRIKANMFRTDNATSTENGRLVSDTKWLLVPSEEDMPLIDLNE